MTKIWANSGDSHVLEPDDLWLQSLPSRLAGGLRAASAATSTRSSTSTASGWTVS